MERKIVRLDSVTFAVYTTHCEVQLVEPSLATIRELIADGFVPENFNSWDISDEQLSDDSRELERMMRSNRAAGF